MEFKKDFYRQSITFNCVDEYGSPIKKRSYFYDHIVSYNAFQAPKDITYEGHHAAKSCITLRHKAEGGVFADRHFYTTHCIEELESLFAEVEYKIEQRKPFELQQSSTIRMDFLRATIPLTLTESPLAGKDKQVEHIFYDQLVGHRPYTLTTQYHKVPFAKTAIILKSEGCFGKREIFVTETEDELRQLLNEAEEQIEAKAIGLLKQLNL